MDLFKKYKISFAGLDTGKHEFEFDIKQEFFDLFETELEFDQADLKARVMLDVHSNFTEAEILIRGSVELVCDITNEKFRYPLENKIQVLIKFGEAFDDSEDDIITLPEGETEFDPSQLIYEAVVLAIPMKKISPNASAADLEAWENYGEDNSEEPHHEVETDPRWDALKKLKNGNKN